jgi:hypothetical protein
MSTFQATLVQSPDPALGGLAVNSPTVTGHASSQATTPGGGGFQSKTCRWSGFPSLLCTDIRLIFDYSYNFVTFVGTQSNCGFDVSYALDGGGNPFTFSAAVAFSGTSGSGTATFSAIISGLLDISLIHIRDNINAIMAGVGTPPVTTGQVSNIRLEANPISQGPICLM